MQKTPLQLGAALSEIKPWAVFSHQATGSPSLQQFHLEIRVINYLIQTVNTSLPCTECGDCSGKNTSFCFKVVTVLLSVHGRLLLVAHWSTWWGIRFGWRVKGWFLTSAVWTWRDTFSELSSSRFLDLCEDVLKKHVIYQRHCHSSHSLFLYLKILCSAFLWGRNVSTA